MNQNNIRPYRHTAPQIDPSCYVDAMAVIVGDAVLGENASVWPFAVVRADVNHIRIGRNSNVQDHCVLHVSHKSAANPQGSPLLIGEETTIGHHVTLHGCTIGKRVLVGINSVVLDDAVIEDEVIIGAASLVPSKKRLQSGYLYVGSPVRQIRPLTRQELDFLPYSAQHYVRVMRNHKINQTENI